MTTGAALPARTRAGYAAGSLVTGAFATVPGLLLLPFLTGELAVPAALAGLVVLLPKAWDVVLNPIAGRISDRAGMRTPFLLAGVDYVARLTLGDAGTSRVLFAAFVGPAVLTAPVWARVGARVGKRAGFRAASVLLGVAAAALVVAGSAPLWVVAVVAAVAGVGYAGVQVFPLAMLPDVTADSGQVGAYAGVWTAAETLGFALGPGLYALVLAAGGFASGTDVTQTGGALFAVVVGFSLVPAVLVLTGAALLRKGVLR